MKTLDFTKYLGTYTLQEAQEISNKIKAEIFELEKQNEIDIIKEIYPNCFVELVIHPKKGGVDLSKLAKNQKVTGCKIKGYYTLLTEKINEQT